MPHPLTGTRFCVGQRQSCGHQRGTADTSNGSRHSVQGKVFIGLSCRVIVMRQKFGVDGKSPNVAQRYMSNERPSTGMPEDTEEDSKSRVGCSGFKGLVMSRSWVE